LPEHFGSVVGGVSVAVIRDAHGRFTAKPKEELSTSYWQRIERGQRRGLSLSRARGHETQAFPMWNTSAAAEREGYHKALNVLRRMRHGESLSVASRAEHTTPDAVRRYVGAALSRDQRGRFRANPTDRFVRRMKFVDAHGIHIVEPANSHEASKLAEYWAAVDHYLKTGDDRHLRRFRRMLLRTRNKLKLPFVTDLDTLDQLARAGELSFEDLYELAA
jgi:hypothetical protein